MSEAAWRFERPPDLPKPQPAEEAEPFFEALREGRLIVQRCTTCRTLAHPPRAMCRDCQGVTFDWRTASGQGEVYSYVVTHQAIHPALVGYTPMATVEVALSEGPHLTSNLVDVAPDDIEIGMSVEVVFEDVGDNTVLPLFRRARANGLPRG